MCSVQLGKTTDKRGQRGMISFQRIQGTHQNSTIIQSHAQKIYPTLYILSKHVSGAEVLARRLIGTCTRPCVNYSILQRVSTCLVVSRSYRNSLTIALASEDSSSFMRRSDVANCVPSALPGQHFGTRLRVLRCGSRICIHFLYSTLLTMGQIINFLSLYV